MHAYIHIRIYRHTPADDENLCSVSKFFGTCRDVNTTSSGCCVSSLKPFSMMMLKIVFTSQLKQLVIIVHSVNLSKKKNPKQNINTGATLALLLFSAAFLAWLSGTPEYYSPTLARNEPHIRQQTLRLLKKHGNKFKKKKRERGGKSHPRHVMTESKMDETKIPPTITYFVHLNKLYY